MSIITSLRRRDLLAGFAACLGATAARAQSYPSRPIRLLIPHEPGSSVDVLARQVTAVASPALGQPLVVTNVPGSGGVIGLTQLARSARDGYTFGMVANNLAIVPSLYRLPFDPLADIMTVCITVSGPMVLVVNPALPAQTMTEFLALARSRRGDTTLTMGSAGAGTVGHLAGEMMAAQAGIQLLHVPYRGNNTFVTDLVSGQIQCGLIAAGTAIPLLRSGRVRAIALTTASRVAALPEVPTFAESGLPGYELSGWQALIAPTGTPRPMVEEVRERVVAALRSEEVARILAEEGRQVVASLVEEAAAIVANDTRRFAELAQRIGLRPEN